MTARAIKKDREGYIEAGMDDYISKPIHRKEWNEVVVRSLVRKPVLTPGYAHHCMSHSRPPIRVNFPINCLEFDEILSVTSDFLPGTNGRKDDPCARSSFW